MVGFGPRLERTRALASRPGRGYVGLERVAGPDVPRQEFERRVTPEDWVAKDLLFREDEYLVMDYETA